MFSPLQTFLINPRNLPPSQVAKLFASFPICKFCLQVFGFANLVCKFFGFGNNVFIKNTFLQDYDKDNSTSLYFTQTEVKSPVYGSKINQFPRQVLDRVPTSLLYLGAIYSALFVIGRLVCYLSDISISYLIISYYIYKVNRCLARYSPRATTNNRPTNRALNKPAWPGPN